MRENVEQILRQSRQPLGLARRALQALPESLVAVERPEQPLELEPQRGERCPKLVGCDGEEVVPRAHGAQRFSVRRTLELEEATSLRKRGAEDQERDRGDRHEALQLEQAILQEVGR